MPLGGQHGRNRAARREALADIAAGRQDNPFLGFRMAAATAACAPAAKPTVRTTRFRTAGSFRSVLQMIAALGEEERRAAAATAASVVEDGSFLAGSR
jgi:hypothetical protein